MLIGHLGTNFSEILIETYKFLFTKMRFKMYRKWRPFCIGLNELIGHPCQHWNIHVALSMNVPLSSVSLVAAVKPSWELWIWSKHTTKQSKTPTVWINLGTQYANQLTASLCQFMRLTPVWSVDPKLKFVPTPFNIDMWYWFRDRVPFQINREILLTQLH